MYLLVIINTYFEVLFVTFSSSYKNRKIIKDIITLDNTVASSR